MSSTTWIFTYILLAWCYTLTNSSPAGMMAFFKTSQCPDGWQEYTNARGRLIHSVTNSSHVNLTLGNPLPDLTVPVHSHNASSYTYIASKPISTNVIQVSFASTGPAYYTLNFPDETPNYPFVHLILCKLLADTPEAVPNSLIAFFDRDVCPNNWTSYGESVGRILIPGVSEVVYSTAPPLSSQEDRMHTHYYYGLFSTAITTYWRYFWNNYTPAAPGTYAYSGYNSEASSGLPYIQLLTCKSSEQGTQTDLPAGIHLFYIDSCYNLPGDLWQNADGNVTGHWIISLPQNGTVGVPFGGNAWAVSSTSGRDGAGHKHSYQGSLSLPSFSMGVAAGGEPFVPAGSYALTGTSDNSDLNMPFLSMPMCVLGDAPIPSASPVSPSPTASSSPSASRVPNDASSDSGVKLATVLIGVIVGVGGCLVVSALLITVLLLRRTKQQRGWENAEKQPEHYTISISMSAIQTDSSITIHNIQVNQKLGGGNFGEVFAGIWNGTTPVALKKLKSREQLQEFAQEAKVLLSLNHPNIVRCHGIHTSSSGDQYIVMEHLSSGSLDNVLRREPNLVIGDLLIMAKHAAAGMLYLEQQRIVHRDLALRNLLVASEATSYTVKVSDFGLSRKISESGFYLKIDTQGIPIRWTAPEVFEKGLYSTKSDVWSFGVTLWELFSFGQIPYPGMTNFEVMQKVVQGLRLDCPRDCPEAIFSLMRKCWNQNPESRPAFKEIYDVIESVAKSHTHRSLQWIDNDEDDVPSNTNSNNYNTQDGQQEHTYNS